MREDLARCYAVLEVDPAATEDEVKAAYLDLVKVWHPDRYQHESERLKRKAEERLKAINEAYDRLRSGFRGEAPRRETKPSESSTAVELYPCSFGARWGYVNRDGKLVISPRFDVAEAFSEGLAHVAETSLHGYIDATGDYSIHPQYTKARSFSQGLAAVVMAVKWGYIDRADRYVITPLYDDCTDFAEGLASVNWRGRWGYIDRNGLFKIPPRFTQAGKFSDGWADVTIGEQPAKLNRLGEVFVGGHKLALG